MWESSGYAAYLPNRKGLGPANDERTRRQLRAQRSNVQQENMSESKRRTSLEGGRLLEWESRDGS